MLKVGSWVSYPVPFFRLCVSELVVSRYEMGGSPL